MKKLVVELTKAGHIEQAQKVQDKVDTHEAELSPKTTVMSAVGGEELEIWKKKALEEFPALKILDANGGKAQTQDMRGFGNWSNGTQLLWLDAKVGSTLTLVLPVQTKGMYRLKGVLTQAGGYGIVTISLDGKEALRMFDGYDAGKVICSDELNWGNHHLEAGNHELTFTITGANPSALKRHTVGLDYVKLQAASNTGEFKPER